MTELLFKPRSDFSHHICYISQTTTALWVADITGALMNFGAFGDSFYHCTLTGLQQFGANRAGCVSEAVADKDSIVVGVFLMHPFAQIGFREGLRAVIGKIDNWAVGGSAEEIVVLGLNLVEGHGQQCFDRLRTHLFPPLAASWAKFNLFGCWPLDNASGGCTAICLLRCHSICPLPHPTRQCVALATGHK